MTIGIGIDLKMGNMSARDAFAPYRIGGNYPILICDLESNMFAIGDGGSNLPSPVTQAGFIASGSSGICVAAVNLKASDIQSVVSYFTPPDPIGTGEQALWQLTSGAGSQAIYATQRDTNTDVRFWTTSTTLQALIDAGSSVPGARTGHAASFAENDFAASLNGASVVTDTSGIMPTTTLDEVHIADGVTSPAFTGTLHRAVFYGELLTDAQLEAASAA